MILKKTKLTYSEFSSFCKAKRRVQNNLFISKDSVKPWFVKKFFVENKQYLMNATCIISQRKKSNCISLKNKEFQNILRAAVRYYYDEEDYNPHLGGDLKEILGDTNRLFKAPIHDDIICEATEDLISSQNFHRNPSEGVSLFYNHPKVKREVFFAVKDKSYVDWTLNDIKKRKRHIKRDLALCTKKLKKGLILFRGRPKFTHKKYFLVEGEDWCDFIKAPFTSKKDMGPPPSGEVEACGRCHRKGMSIFYLASDLQTVIAELKQKLHTYVSVATFTFNKKLKVADLSLLDYYDFAKNDELISSYAYLKAFGELFTKPVNDQNGEEYRKTQLIADIIKSSGYSGVVYNSSVADGKNYAFFSARNFRFNSNSPKLIKIKKIKYYTKNIIYKPFEDPATEIKYLKEKEV